MFGVVEAQAADCTYLAGRERTEKKPYGGSAVGKCVGAEDIAAYDSGGCGSTDIGCVSWENCVAVVNMAITGKEANEALRWVGIMN